MKRIIYFIILCCMIGSCGTLNTVTRESQYAKMYEEKPVTLLVMPPINNSTNVEAKDLLYTSISRPLVEAGYYVIPPLLAMDVLKAESAYDSEMFFDAPLSVFNNYFGADAVVFSVIDTWAKKGLGIETKIRYVIKSAYTNEILFDRSCDLYLDLSVDSGADGLLGALVDLAASAIKRQQGIKDYGKLIPGHGGIMDRFDSVIVTAPMIYFLSMILIKGLTLN